MGSARSCSLTASRMRVTSFSFVSNSLRAVNHSSRVATCGLTVASFVAPAWIAERVRQVGYGGQRGFIAAAMIFCRRGGLPCMTVTITLTRDEFSQAAEPLRRELFAHCYRMLGSVHEAEDMVQETYLRAWRGYDGFEGRSSLRTWLYRIATTTCLRALERAAKRPTPSGLGQAPAQSFDDPVGDALDLPWLQPAPDRLLGDPAEIAVGRDNVRLAFVAALQHLPPKQRAVLILRDVLAWSADEAAELLETSRAAVNSALQRARAQLAAVPVDEIAPISDAQRRELVESFVDAYLNADMAALTKLLAAD